MRRYYFTLTDSNYNDLNALINDGNSKAKAIKEAKTFMEANNIKEAILQVNSIATENILDMIDINF